MAEVYRKIRKASTRHELDRGQWAGEVQMLAGYDFEGSGEQSFDIDFGIIFEGTPYYTWGAELQDDETLTDGDFPHINSGVVSWVTQPASESQFSNLLYSGARVWYSVFSSRSYRTRLRTSFRGIVYKSPEHFQE